MSQKRNAEDAHIPSEGSSSRPPDRRPRLQSVICEVMRLHSFQNILEPALEPLIRRVVKEEVELALKRHLNNMKWNCGKETHTTEFRSLKLKFLNSLFLPVFTGTRIESDECSTIKVALVDAITGRVVQSGPESSAKVEMVVLEGDFDGDEEDNWTAEEFKNNIVREREGKKSLLMGDSFLYLKEGVGLVGEISFTDNSSWTRSRKFRLGARVVDCFDGIIIREAKCKSFIVRDHRGELYKKHHPPSLSDEVWRLEKIGKDGAFHKRLSRENIFTVKDFLILLIINPPRLRHILGTGMSTKMWEATLEHARTCVLDKRVYLYCPPDPQQKASVVFNVVGQLMGFLSESEYLRADKLSETQKADARNLVISAFEHWGDVTFFEDEASLMGGIAQLPNAPTSPGVESSSMARFLGPPCEASEFSYEHPAASTSDAVSPIYTLGCESVLDDYLLPAMDLGYDHPALSFDGQVPGSMICDTESMTRAFCDDEQLQFMESDYQRVFPGSTVVEPLADLHGALSSFLSARSRSRSAAVRRWKMLFSIARWMVVRRAAALRRRGHDQRFLGYGFESEP